MILTAQQHQVSADGVGRIETPTFDPGPSDPAYSVSPQPGARPAAGAQVGTLTLGTGQGSLSQLPAYASSFGMSLTVSGGGETKRAASDAAHVDDLDDVRATSIQDSANGQAADAPLETVTLQATRIEQVDGGVSGCWDLSANTTCK